MRPWGREPGSPPCPLDVGCYSGDGSLGCGSASAGSTHPGHRVRTRRSRPRPRKGSQVVQRASSRKSTAGAALSMLRARRSEDPRATVVAESRGRRGAQRARYASAAPLSSSGGAVLAAMSLFLDSEVQVKGGARPVASAWCAVDPILAVAASDNSLALYGEEVRGLQRRRAPLLRFARSHAASIDSLRWDAPWGGGVAACRESCTRRRLKSAPVTSRPSRGTPPTSCSASAGRMVRPPPGAPHRRRPALIRAPRGHRAAATLEPQVWLHPQGRDDAPRSRARPGMESRRGEARQRRHCARRARKRAPPRPRLPTLTRRPAPGRARPADGGP